MAKRGDKFSRRFYGKPNKNPRKRIFINLWLFLRLLITSMLTNRGNLADYFSANSKYLSSFLANRAQLSN